MRLEHAVAAVADADLFDGHECMGQQGTAVDQRGRLVLPDGLDQSLGKFIFLEPVRGDCGGADEYISRLEIAAAKPATARPSRRRCAPADRDDAREFLSRKRRFPSSLFRWPRERHHRSRWPREAATGRSSSPGFPVASNPSQSR